MLRRSQESVAEGQLDALRLFNQHLQGPGLSKKCLIWRGIRWADLWWISNPICLTFTFGSFRDCEETVIFYMGNFFLWIRMSYEFRVMNSAKWQRRSRQSESVEGLWRHQCKQTCRYIALFYLKNKHKYWLFQWSNYSIL